MSDKNYFLTHSKNACCGCRACEHTCNKNAITMVSDEEGFIYPKIDEKLCVKCNACINVCPVSQERNEKKIIKIYELQNKNDDQLKKSSSGGVFISLALHIIDNGGIVFGTVLNENYEAAIISAKTKDELEKMQGSKYVFSNTGNTFKEAEAYLKSGKLVLYTGSPCQIAGLKNYLKKDYENLITMDFLCHGMPSASIFKENVNLLSKKYKGVISDYKFRDKALKGWGHVTSFNVNGKKHYESGKLNNYFCGFINGYLNRYSCYSCHFSGENKYSDITVGDFWGCKSDVINSKKGVSFIALNTNSGKTVFDKINNDFLYKEITPMEVAKFNSSLLNSRNEKIPEIRKTIYNKVKTEGYENISKKHLTSSKYFLLKIKMILDIIRNKISERK